MQNSPVKALKQQQQKQKQQQRQAVASVQRTKKPEEYQHQESGMDKIQNPLNANEPCMTFYLSLLKCSLGGEGMDQTIRLGANKTHLLFFSVLDFLIL